MSVVINTNYAATLASNNLAASNSLLQRSLNRLSSGSKIVNPADDAGGLAVSMKLSATAKRQGAAASNLGNSASFLQSQDGVLKTIGKVLERISELKTLATDPTKNSSDLANYNEEFTALQAEVASLASESFNGISLFGCTAMSVGATGDAGGSSIAVGGTDLLGIGAANLLTEGFSNLSAWTVTGGTPTVSGGVLTLDNNEELRTNATFTGPFEVTFEARSQGLSSLLDIRTTTGTGTPDLARFDYGDVSDTSWHSVRMVVAADGSVSSYLDGSGTAYDTQSAWGGGSTSLFLSAWGGGGTEIRNLQVTDSDAGTDVSTLTTAADLTSVSLADITGAIQEIATFRAENGAQQSRLSFAAEVLATNKANLEAANSRISDVDVAEESTQLARYNILVQAGTAMLGQANQSSQIALRLLN